MGRDTMNYWKGEQREKDEKKTRKRKNNTKALGLGQKRPQTL